MITFALYATFGIIIITAILSALSFILDMVQDTKGSVKIIGGIVGLAIIFVIGYAIAPTAPIPGVEEASKSTLRLVGAGMTTVTVLTVLAIGASIYSFITDVIN